MFATEDGVNSSTHSFSKPLILHRVIVLLEPLPWYLGHRVGKTQSITVHIHTDANQPTLDWGRKPEYPVETSEQMENMQTCKLCGDENQTPKLGGRISPLTFHTVRTAKPVMLFEDSVSINKAGS